METLTRKFNLVQDWMKPLNIVEGRCQSQWVDGDSLMVVVVDDKLNYVMEEEGNRL